MPIEIIIKTDGDELATGVANPLTADDKKEKADEKVSGKLSKENAMLLKFGIAQAKQWASAGVRAYTSYTGNSILQEKIDNALAVVEMGTTIGIAFATNVVLGAITVAGYVAKAGMDEFQNRMANREAIRSQSFVEQALGKRDVRGGVYGV